MEELEAKFKLLQGKLHDTELRCAYLEGENKVKASPIVYHTKTEKLIKKYHDGDDIADWIESITNYIAKFSTEAEKVDCILNNLDHRPYTEVRFRIDRSKVSSVEVLKILSDIYGNKNTFSQLQKKLFSREQQPGESIDDYSYALIDLVIHMEKLDPKLRDNSDQILKDIFSEGVTDVRLKHEMKRLNRERTEKRFFEMRDEAKRWLQDELIKNRTDNVTHETVKVDMLLEAFKEQKEEMKKLSEAVYYKPSSNRGQMPTTYHHPSSDWDQNQHHQSQIGGNQWQYGYKLQYDDGRHNQGTYNRPHFSSHTDYQNSNQQAQSRGRGQFRGMARGRSQLRGEFRGRAEFRGRSNYSSFRNNAIPTVDTIRNNNAVMDEVNSQNTRNPVICFYCNLPNHIELNCIQRIRDERSNQPARATNYNHSN
jgi:RNA-binding protein YhbY